MLGSEILIYNCMINYSLTFPCNTCRFIYYRYHTVFEVKVKTVFYVLACFIIEYRSTE